jgi:hypothetical protein
VLLQAFPHTSPVGTELSLDLPDLYEVLVNEVRIAYHCGVTGAVWGVGVGVAVVTLGRATSRWARQRCEEALASARLMPVPSERSFALIPGLEGRSPDRAQVREQRAFQQALDTERRGDAFLARRVTPTVPPCG